MSAHSAAEPPNNRSPDVRPSAERVARTERALNTAMAELLWEQPFAAITVQRVLDRAGVGRATFYAHYQDKHDLLLSSFTRMLAAMDAHLEADPPDRRRLMPVREFFEHVGSADKVLSSLEAAGKLPLLLELAVLHFARRFEAAAADPLTARCLAAAMIEQLRWWLGARQRPAAAAMDERFHVFAAKVLAADDPANR